jgi:fatty acid desaturase
MDDFVGSGDVLSKERVKELSKRRNGPGLIYLASHFGAIGVTTYGLFLTQGTWWCVPIFFLQGVLINFLYAPEHECDHATAFSERWMNVAVARFCGIFILLPNDSHRWSHFTHHRHTQNWELDPELTARPVLDTAGKYLWVLSGLPSMIGRAQALFLHAVGRLDPPYLRPAQKLIVERMARGYLIVYLAMAVAAVVMQSWWPVYYWLGPYVLTNWVYWVQGLGEHTGLTHEPHTLLNTRTMKANWFMRWANWNMTYHTVHHTYPSVPFYRLPELHKEVERELGFALPSAGYFELHWGHLKALSGGATELGLCAEHDRQIQGSGALSRLTRWTRAT